MYLWSNLYTLLNSEYFLFRYAQLNKFEDTDSECGIHFLLTNFFFCNLSLNMSLFGTFVLLNSAVLCITENQQGRRK